MIGTDYTVCNIRANNEPAAINTFVAIYFTVLAVQYNDLVFEALLQCIDVYEV